MNLVDLIIIVFLVVGALLGFIRGFIKQTVIFVGNILIIILAFIFKGTVAAFLYNNLPFLNFKYFEGITSLNILFYEILGFIIAYILLSIVLRIIVSLTGIIEKLLKMTVVLGIISRLLGMIVGFIQSYVILYLLLILVSFPSFNIKEINKSKYKDTILNDTPILSKITKKFINTFSEIVELKDSPKTTEEEKTTLDKKIYDIIIKNGVVANEKLKELITKGKLKVNQ